MTLKEELEILRGEPIEEYSIKPEDVPCIETSDAGKLCKHPVVSVNMITYNHEPYIRQAIEGVMMQKTDFEFELIIGEDCSQDKTREICFEYQKKYPDKIRVLWWHENLRKVNHPGGGNSARVFAHCRGEFIALCEGDDYWIDPLKLQKQVDVMRKYPNVGFCFCGAFDYREGSADGIFRDFYLTSTFPVGLIRGMTYIKWNVYGSDCSHGLGRESYVRTATTMIRSDVYRHAKGVFEILSWRLRLGDVPIWLSLASLSDVYYLQDRVAVYRSVSTGACAVLGASLWRDNLLTRIYFYHRLSLDSVAGVSSYLRDAYLPQLSRSLIQLGKCTDARDLIRQIEKVSRISWTLSGWRNFVLRLIIKSGMLSVKTGRLADRILSFETRIANLVVRRIRFLCRYVLFSRKLR